MSKGSSSGGGISFTEALFVLFLGLKLAGFIDWSWWWVTAPLWIVVLGATIAAVLSSIGEQKGA